MDKNKENCKVYSALRKNLDLSQAKVEEITTIDRNTLSKFENGDKIPNPDDIVQLSECYNSKRLCRWYCAEECPVGKRIHLLEIDALKAEDFAQTMLTIHSCIRKLSKIDLDRLVDVSQDGKIDESEIETYKEIKNGLEQLARAYGALLRIEEDDDGTIIYKEK